VDGAGSLLDADLLDGQHAAAFEAAGALAAHLIAANPHAQYLLASGYTAADVLSKLLGVDGAGSGLDADLLRGTTPTAFGLSLVDDADAPTARTTLGLVIGTNVQAQNANLSAMAGLTGAADKAPYFTGAGALAMADFPTFGRSLAAALTAAAGRTTLGLGTMATEASTAYLAASGATVGATSQAQTFTNSIIATAGMRPASDITNWKLATRANGTSGIITLNTVDSSTLLAGRLGVSGQTANGIGRDLVSGDTVIYSASMGFLALGANNGNQVIFSVTAGVIGGSRINLTGGSIWGTPPHPSTHTFGGGSYDPGNGVFAGSVVMAVLAGDLKNAYADMTVTNAATLYIDKAPFQNPFSAFSVAGNKWALWIDDGSTRIDGNVTIGGTTEPTDKLDVAGTVRADALRLDVTPTAETPTMTHTITFSANGTNYKIPCVVA